MATEQLDLIDRKSLLRRICAERDEVEIKTACDIGYHNGLNMGASMTINAPTIEARPVVHGRWVHPKGYVVSNGFLCSECGHEESSHHPINPRPSGCCIADEHGNFFHPPKTNYCPNCGAKMDGGADNG